MSSTGNNNSENMMEVGADAPANPDFVTAPQPNEGDELKQRFSEQELLGIKENCLGDKVQPLWTTMVLTQFESVTLILTDWLIRGHEARFWGGAPPPMSVSWLPQHYRDTPLSVTLW